VLIMYDAKMPLFHERDQAYAYDALVCSDQYLMVCVLTRLRRDAVGSGAVPAGFGFGFGSGERASVTRLSCAYDTDCEIAATYRRPENE